MKNKKRLVLILMMILGGAYGLKTAISLRSRSSAAPEVKSGSQLALDSDEGAESVGVRIKNADPNLQERERAPASGEISKTESSADLQMLAAFQKKIFLSEEEKLQRDQLVTDPSFLLSLRSLLLSEAKDKEKMLQQNLALDVLYEAAWDMNVATAKNVLESIVEDHRVEESDIEISELENLAGIKGEILLHWLNREPEQRAELQELLPGPVSQKIWRNVQAVQTRNESLTADANE